MDAYEELKEFDRFNVILSQNMNGKVYYVLPKNAHSTLFVKDKNANEVINIDIDEIAQNQGGFCNICKLPLGKDKILDYRIPTSRGGKNEPSNMQVLCKACSINKKKKCMPCICPCDTECKLAYPEYSSIIRVLDQK